MKNYSNSNLLKNLRKKNKNKKIGLCHGVYDIFHHGHLEHLKSAKLLCDILVVSITEDKFINKGPGRPYHTEIQRAEILESMNLVDLVFIARSESAIEVIADLKPDFYIKGKDYKNLKSDESKKIVLEKKAIQKVNGRIIFTNNQLKSSTTIYNDFIVERTLEEEKIIRNIKNKFKLDEILTILDRFIEQDVLIVGEPIIDQYVYGDARGLSNKSSNVSIGKTHQENLLGGSLAIARDIHNLGSKVKLISANYKNVNFFREIRNKLPKNIKWINMNLKGCELPIKTRFVTANHAQKLFEISNIKNTNYWNREKINDFFKIIKKELKPSTILVLADYGHGLFSSDLIKKIESIRNFTVLNAQTNSNNLGYNYFTKYKKYNYLSIDENEFRLGVGDRYNKISTLISKSIKNRIIKAPFAVTTGIKGSHFINKKQKLYSCPIFYKNVKDTTGAGDAFFGITSLLVKQNVDPDLILFLGNCYAGLKCQYIANKDSSSLLDLKNVIKSILR